MVKNPRAKGRRQERRAEERLENQGFATARAKMSRFGDNDFFNKFDIIAIHPEETPRLIQVKSNVAKGKEDILEFAHDYILWKDFNVELWVWHDYKGWRIMRIENGEWTKTVDER